MRNKPTDFRKLTKEQTKEMLEIFHFGRGADSIVEDLEEIFQMALNNEEKNCECVSRELSNGYFTMRQVIKLLKYLDPYQNKKS